jgi:hypothetical protein
MKKYTLYADIGKHIMASDDLTALTDFMVKLADIFYGQGNWRWNTILDPNDSIVVREYRGGSRFMFIVPSYRN